MSTLALTTRRSRVIARLRRSAKASVSTPEFIFLAPFIETINTYLKAAALFDSLKNSNMSAHNVAAMPLNQLRQGITSANEFRYIAQLWAPMKLTP